MATKKTAAEQGLQQKVKVLTKLFDAGCKTEKDLKALTLPTILKIPDVTVPDMTVITELQEQVAKNRLFSYLGGGTDEPKRHDRMTATSFGATKTLMWTTGERTTRSSLKLMNWTTTRMMSRHSMSGWRKRITTTSPMSEST